MSVSENYNRVEEQQQGVTAFHYHIFLPTYSPEIPDFLSDEECDHIISLAEEMGLSTSFIGLDHLHIKRDLDEAMMEAGACICVIRREGEGEAQNGSLHVLVHYIVK